MIRYVLTIERPLMKLSASAWMKPLEMISSFSPCRSRSSLSLSSSLESISCSRLSIIRHRSGDIFSCSSPGKNPISSSNCAFDLHTGVLPARPEVIQFRYPQSTSEHPAPGSEHWYQSHYFFYHGNPSLPILLSFI